jgi:hypothetical protein
MGELAWLRDCGGDDFDGELGEDVNGPYLLDED